MNQRTNAAFGSSVSLPNPIAEMLAMAPNEGTGTKFHRPRYFQGRVVGVIQIGMAVVLSGVVAAASDELGGDSVAFAAAAPGGIADGIADRVDGNYIRVRCLEGDLELANITVGADYVVGTDSRLAKSGDTNYPVLVASPQVVAVGWCNNRVMLGMGSRHAAALASVSNHFLGDSDLINTDSTPVRVKKATVNVDLKFDPRLLVVGDEIEFKAICAIGASSAQPRLQLKIGAAVLLTFNGPAPNALGDEFVAEGRIIVRETGATGKVLTTGICYTSANGFIAAQGFNVIAPLALDLSVPSVTVDMFGYFSVAGTNGLTVRDASLRLRS